MNAAAVLCWLAAWCCASVAAGAAWSAMRTGSTAAVVAMVAAAFTGAGLVLIGVSLWR